MITITDLSNIAVVGGDHTPGFLPDFSGFIFGADIPAPHKADDRSSFLESKLVVRSGNLLLSVHHYDENGAPTGREIDEWEEELSYGAFSLRKPIAFVPHGKFWMFRKTFAELLPGALTDNGFVAYAGNPLDLPEFYEEVFLVNEKQAAIYRADWIEKSFEKAWMSALAEDWLLVRRYADLAFVLMPGFDASIYALLNIAFEKLGDTKRAAWEVDVARRSCGDAFVVTLIERKNLIHRSLAAKKKGPSSPTHE